MGPDLLAKYAGAVPRYTSYPTAPQFGPAVDGARYGAWLAGLDPGQVLSLYLHIPFCRSLCWFCGCSTRVVNDHDPVARYLETLLREIGLVADHLGRRFAVGHVHLGGGTPTMLSARDLAVLAERLRDRFDLAPGADIAIEIDPRVLTDDQAATLGRIGVTRASLGVQDFDPAVQHAINREQSYETTGAAVERLRRHGVGSINLDLLYGLPYQTERSVTATIEQALTLEPDRLALFGYAHVPWMRKHQRLIPEAALPDAAARVAQFAAASAALQARGFVPVGLDHFARPDDEMARALSAGRLRRNFQGYTTDAAAVLIGLGASAIGALPGGYVQNTPDVRAYRQTIAQGRFAVARGIAVDDDDRLRRAIIERLMCDLAAPVEQLCREHGRDFAAFEPEQARLAEMAQDGVVVVAEGWLRVTEAGRPLVRTVCAVFDRYLPAGAGRHSSAV